MVHWVGITLSGVSADAEALLDLRFGHAGASMRQVQSVTLKYNSLGASAYALLRMIPTVAPPRPGPGSGAANAPFLEVNVANATGDDLTIDLMAFEFDPNAAQITPWPYLASAYSS